MNSNNKEGYVENMLQNKRRRNSGEAVPQNDSFVETTDRVGLINYTKMKGGDKYIKDRGVNPYRIV